MTVAELIAELQKMPQDAKVIMTKEFAGRFDMEVRDVLYNENTKVDSGTVELDNWPKDFLNYPDRQGETIL